MRRRRSSSDGKNDPTRSLGICTSTSPDVVDTVAALIAAGADRLGGLGLDELLQPGTNQLGEHSPGIGGLERIEVSKQGRMILGHRVVCLPLESLGR